MAKHDYKAEGAEELNIHKSEKLVLLDDSKQWWKVQNFSNESGFVPSNYVRRAKPSILTSLRNTLGRKKGSDVKSAIQTPHSPALTVRGGGGSSGNDNHSENGSHGSDTQPYDAPALGQTRVRFAYEAKQTDEITLNKADVVSILAKSEDGWWKVRKGTDTGWYPSNYLEQDEPIDNDSAGLYMQPPDGYRNQRRDANDAPTAPDTVVVAVYAYIGRNSEELSFEKNETLEIVEKPSGDPEWWKARNKRGDVGVIPRNYVETKNYPPSASQSDSSLSGGATSSSDRTHSGSVASRSELTSTPFSSKDWYFGSITRATCEEMLSNYADDGDFIVRDSETNVSEHYVIKSISIILSLCKCHMLIHDRHLV